MFNSAVALELWAAGELAGVGKISAGMWAAVFQEVRQLLEIR